MDDVISHDVNEDIADPFFFSAVDGTFCAISGSATQNSLRFSPLRCLWIKMVFTLSFSWFPL